jgi:hypothetical protein
LRGWRQNLSEPELVITNLRVASVVGKPRTTRYDYKDHPLLLLTAYREVPIIEKLSRCSERVRPSGSDRDHDDRPRRQTTTTDHDDRDHDAPQQVSGGLVMDRRGKAR